MNGDVRTAALDVEQTIKQLANSPGGNERIHGIVDQLVRDYAMSPQACQLPLHHSGCGRLLMLWLKHFSARLLCRRTVGKAGYSASLQPQLGSQISTMRS